MDADNLITVLEEYNKSEIEEKEKYIIILGGIGDFLTINYIYNFAENNNIIFISKQSLILKKLLKSISIFKNKYFSIYFDFDTINKPGFNCSLELLEHFPQLSMIPIINIGEYFPKIRENYIQQPSNKLKDICKFTHQKLIHNIKLKFNLPDNIVFISPFTEDNRVNCIKCNVIHSTNSNCIYTRNFVGIDYHNTCVFLKNRNLIGVIISLTEIVIPENIRKQNLFINLSKKTTLLEGIEILKTCKYYVGIDTLFSVIASKILSKNNIFIKCNNKHAYDYQDIYYFPQQNLNINSFIKFQ